MGEPTESLSFEESLIELERTVRDLEDGRLGLEEALSRYEQGVRLIKQCHAQLYQAEQRILTVTGVDEAGEPLLEPFKHEATASGRGEPRRKPAAPCDSEDAPSVRLAREVKKKADS